MAYSLPDGTKVFLGTAFSVAKAITAISNTNPAVVQSVAHGFADGDFVVVNSGWNLCDERVFRVDAVLENEYALEGLDATNNSNYPVGSSAGSARKIETFTQVTQILGLTTDGGDLKEVTVEPLESDVEIKIPSGYSAQSLKMTIGDDPTLSGYQALKVAADARAIRPMKLLNKNNSVVLYNGYVSMNETPTKSKGNVDTVSAGLSLLSKPNRYAS